jgi:hypothetical protein
MTTMRFDCSYDELLDVVGALRHRADVFESLRTLAPGPEYWVTEAVKHRTFAERLIEEAAAQTRARPSRLVS